MSDTTTIARLSSLLEELESWGLGDGKTTLTVSGDGGELVLEAEGSEYVLAESEYTTEALDDHVRPLLAVVLDSLLVLRDLKGVPEVRDLLAWEERSNADTSVLPQVGVPEGGDLR